MFIVSVWWGCSLSECFRLISWPSQSLILRNKSHTKPLSIVNQILPTIDDYEIRKFNHDSPMNPTISINFILAMSSVINLRKLVSDWLFVVVVVVSVYRRAAKIMLESSRKNYTIESGKPWFIELSLHCIINRKKKLENCQRAHRKVNFETMMWNITCEFCCC